MQNLDIKTFQDSLSQIKSVLVLLPEKPEFDAVAAALAFSTSLKESGKEVTVACPSPMLVEFNRLVGVNKVTDNIDNRNLVISFKDYDAEGIEKVSYNIENGQFMLVIVPKTSLAAPQKEQVEIGHRGVSGDLIIVTGATNKQDLGKFADKEELWNTPDAKITILGRLPAQGFKNTTELVNPQASTVSESAFGVIESLGLPINQDIATNLFMGLRSGTNNFQKNITADTFATASRLLRSGAKTETLPQPPEVQKEQEPKNWPEPRLFKGNTLP